MRSMHTSLPRIFLPVFTVVAMLLLTLPSSAQYPPLLTFPETPCDSTYCDTVVIANTSSATESITSVSLREGASFSISPDVSVPLDIPPGDSTRIPICFTPLRRGAIPDSIFFTVVQGASPREIRSIRLVGRGVGPEISITPTVLNFPKTNPPGNADLPIIIRNSGERDLMLNPGDLTGVAPPFQLLTALPVNIPAGDSVELQFRFEPTESGIYSRPVDIMAGCNRTLQIYLNASTDLIGTGAVIRISKIGFNPVNKEQAPCNVSNCTELTVSNVGTAPLTIESMNWRDGTRGYSIDPSVTIPFIVDANQSRVIEVCLNSSVSGNINDTLIVESNNRGSIAFGMVIDVSGSMRTGRIPCGNTTVLRLDEAKTQAKSFIEKTLLHIPSLDIQDQIAISKYNELSEHIFDLSFVTDPVRADAQAEIDALTASKSTNTGAALLRMFDTLAQSPLPNRVVVLLTDGKTDDLLTRPASMIIDEANKRGIKVFPIGIGLAQQSQLAVEYIRDIAQGTNGTWFDASDCGSLQGAFETITDSVSRGSIALEPFSIRITDPVLVAHDLQFDSLYIGDIACDTITITNVGEGNGEITQVEFRNLLGDPSGEFFFPDGTEPPFMVPEGDQLKIPVCFQPQALRNRGGTVSLNYNDCESVPVESALSGFAWAEANLRLTDERIGAFGEQVQLPVYGDSALAGYEVGTVTWRIRWNYSMLDLKNVAPGSAANGANVQISSPVEVDGRYAEAEITVTGEPLQTAGELALLDFEILRGDTLGSTISILSGTFEDGNPRTLLKNFGTVTLDSTCFRDFKPIIFNGTSAAKISIGEPLPSPARSAFTLPIESDGEARVHIDLYGADGTLVRSPELRDLTPGTNELRVSVEGLRPGAYYTLLRTEEGRTAVRKIVVVH